MMNDVYSNARVEGDKKDSINMVSEYEKKMGRGDKKEGRLVSLNTLGYSSSTRSS